MHGLVIGPGRELTYVSVVSALIDASTSAHHYTEYTNMYVTRCSMVSIRLWKLDKDSHIVPRDYQFFPRLKIYLLHEQSLNHPLFSLSSFHP